MRAMTCPRWPITTWKVCDRTRFPVTLLFRRYPRQKIATNNARSGKDGPASPRSPAGRRCPQGVVQEPRVKRSEEHTSELQSLMRISYAVFCLKKKIKKTRNKKQTIRKNKQTKKPPPNK